jgi:catechol 2,3-dioxygenase-like lactoylglutathione lyase family enzyme
MGIQRMDHVGIVVDDMAAAIAFFAELGMDLLGETPVEGEWVDRVVGLDGLRVDSAMMQAPDEGGRIELIKFHAPPAGDGDPAAPPNTLGLRHLAFMVDDVDDTVARLKPHGGELVGTVEDYQDTFRLCYLRGPAGMIVELAERLG